MDGVPDYLDLDSDNDGIPDVIEAESARSDSDGDGLIDNFIDENDDGLHDPISPDLIAIDTDDDGVPDYLDLDSDADGLSDLLEVELIEFDTDNDGVIDSTVDADADGLFDVVDRLILLSSTATGANIVDTDSDGSPNFRDLDSDNDGLEDGEEATDANGDGIEDRLQINEVELKTAVKKNILILW